MFWVIVVCVVVVYIAIMHSKNSSSGLPVTSLNKQKGGLNNPGNLRNFDISWQGRINSDGCEFDNFDTLSNGVRAWGINLFQKVKQGKIRSTSEMIDVLTPAISENPEAARQNYKNLVSQATTWPQLFNLVFKFEDNPSWRNASQSEKNSALQTGLAQAINYVYKGQTPQYFKL